MKRLLMILSALYQSTMNIYGKAGCSDSKKNYIEIKDLFTFTVTLLFIFSTNEVYNNTRT